MKYLLGILLITACPMAALSQNDGMMIRMAELEIDSSQLAAYKKILQEESEASVKLEPGVICIYPMYQKDHPTQVRILEIYASRQAYVQHLVTPHFQKYKSQTLKMVKSLKLIDMVPIDAQTMAELFRKVKKSDLDTSKGFSGD